MRINFTKLSSFLSIATQVIIVWCLRLYQKTLSFDHGLLKIFYPFGRCRYRPTCSDYAIEAVTKHGPLKGGLLSVWRIFRCNPWSKGGWDPVK